MLTGACERQEAALRGSRYGEFEYLTQSLRVILQGSFRTLESFAERSQSNQAKFEDTDLK